MLTLEEVLVNQKNRKLKLAGDNLHKLPFKMAFILGRLSTLEQVRNSHESLLEIAKLVAIAKADGYRSNIEVDEIEKLLIFIQQGAEINKVIEKGDIIIDIRDLGISAKGSSDNKREGLAHLMDRLQSSEIGCVYVTEGVSRLSRDQDKILPYQLLKILKDQQCRLRTPEGIWNPANEKDWRFFWRLMHPASSPVLPM